MSSVSGGSGLGNSSRQSHEIHSPQETRSPQLDWKKRTITSSRMKGREEEVGERRADREKVSEQEDEEE